MELIIVYIGLALAGLFIGICSGLLGIGGGMVMVPMLRLVFGFSAYAATATSLFTMVFTSASGAITHVRNGTCIPKLGLALGLGGCLTSTLGVLAASKSPSWAVMGVAAVIIVYSAINMVRKALAINKDSNRIPSSGHNSADVSIDEPFRMDAKGAALGFAIGLFAGFCAGYVGIGGGFIMVPLMTAWLSVPMKKASGTSLIAIIILSVPGIVTQGVFGNIDYLAGVLMAAGSIPGAVLGAKLVKKLDERTLRLLFAAFLGIAAVILVVNELNLF